jgi:hypothetical protein
MAADASARGTTFEPRGPWLSIGTVGLFVNRIARGLRWLRGEREAVKNGRQTLHSSPAGCRRRRADATNHSKLLDLGITSGREARGQSRATDRAGLPRRPTLAGYPARYARTALTIASASFWR